MVRRIPHEALVRLVEVEPSPEEEFSHLYRTWKEEELKDLWQEIKRIEEAYLRRLDNRKLQVEQAIGVRLKVRVPRSVVRPAPVVSRFAE